MKKIVLTLALLLPLAAAAQTSVEGGVRLSAGADWKIRKGLHLNAEEELRIDGAFQSLGSLRTTLGVEYKPVKFLKLGAGYTLINGYDATERMFKAPRHRLFADAGAHFNWNDFSFSLKERVQYTHRSGSFNVYQNTPDAFAIKSRIGVEYKGWSYLEPGVFFEVRTQLNAPWGYTSGSLQTKSDGTTYYAYTPIGYTHVYNDRYRVILRTDIKLSKHHILRPYVLLDFCSPYEIDTNAEGTRLFSAAYNDYTAVNVGVSYTFKF